MLYSVDQICRILYDTDEPTKAQHNTVLHMCSSGRVNAHKFGRSWLIEIPLESEKFDYDRFADAVVEKLVSRFAKRRAHER